MVLIDDQIKIIFDTWNAYAPVKHSVCTRKMQGAIHFALLDYKEVDVIVKAIIKYGAVCERPKLYWWTASGYMLESFLKTALTRFVDTPLEGFRKDKQEDNSNLLPKIK